MTSNLQRLGSSSPEASRNVLILTAAAVAIYILSSVKFLVRDPLSSDTGAQAFIEIGLLGTAALLVAFATILRRALPTITPAVVGFTIAATLMGISSAFSYWPALSLIKAGMLLVVMAMAVLLCTVASPLTVLRSFYWACLGLTLVGLFLKVVTRQPFFEIDDYSGRMRLSIFNWHPASLGDVVALALLTGFLLKKRPPWFCQLFLLIINIATCARASTALLLLIAVTLFAAQYMINIRGLALSFLALSLVALGLFIVNNAQSPFFDKIGSTMEAFYGDKLGEDLLTLNGRTNVWKNSADLIEHSLLLGYGLEGVRDKILQEESWAGHTHNAYLEVFVSGGLPCLLVFLITWGFSAMRALRDRTGLRLPVLGMYAYMFLFGFTEPNLTYLQFLVVFLIICIDYGLRMRFDADSNATSSGRNKVITEDYQLAFANNEN